MRHRANRALYWPALIVAAAGLACGDPQKKVEAPRTGNFHEGEGNPSAGMAPSSNQHPRPLHDADFGADSDSGEDAERERRDRGISRAVEYELQHYRIDTTAIRVTTVGGRVRLDGTVASLLIRARANRIAETIPGVKSVTNRLQIDRAPDDAVLQSRIEALLLSDPACEEHVITVHVTDGIATLIGEVDTWHERRANELLTMTVRGVHKVRNELVVEKPLEAEPPPTQPLLSTAPTRHPK